MGLDIGSYMWGQLARHGLGLDLGPHACRLNKKAH